MVNQINSTANTTNYNSLNNSKSFYGNRKNYLSNNSMNDSVSFGENRENQTKKKNGIKFLIGLALAGLAVFGGYKLIKSGVKDIKDGLK